MSGTTQTDTDLVCQFCKKSFRKISTLQTHMCEQKRRWNQRGETGVRLGLTTYLRFCEINQGSAKTKNYETFCESPYYSAFVKFGQYLVSIRAVNVSAYIEWILASNKKIDNWTKDSYYDEWLYEYLRKEHPNDALERSLLEIQKWADENNAQLSDFFVKCSPNRICQLINDGRISSWVIYHCNSGIDFLANLTDDQVKIVFKFIEPVFWSKKFKDYVADSLFLKDVLSQAGL
jgi:hypothetical protein